MWRSFSIALALLTRVPVPVCDTSDTQTIGRSILWYPMVGLIIGLALSGISLLAVSAPDMVRTALVLTVWCVLTGGLHLDGLSDSTDALIGSHGNSGRALEIMKDPVAGPMGVAAVSLVLILKFAALTAHVSAETWWMIVLAPVLGRTAIIALFLTTPYVRPGGLGEGLAAHLPRRHARIVLIAVLAVAIIAGGLAALAAIVGAVLAFVFLRRMMMRTIGGATGDTAGALVEVSEVAVLVAAALALPSG